MHRSDSHQPVAIIGGGIVGVAVFRRLCLSGCPTVLLEKRSALLTEASGSNSSLVHCGFDANPLYEESKLVREGHLLLVSFLQSLGSKFYKKTGAVVIAWTQEEQLLLSKLQQKALQNGYDKTVILDAQQTRERCRSQDTQSDTLRGDLKGSLFVPDEYVADVFAVGLALLLQAFETGLGEVWTDAEVVRCMPQHGGVGYVLHTSTGRKLACRAVVNCAGNFADIVESLRDNTEKPLFTAKPRFGQFAVYANPTKEKLPVIIYPVPSARTKGVVMWSNLAGATVVGPTAEEHESRSVGVTKQSSAQLLQQTAQLRLSDALISGEVFHYWGIRPATTVDDYVIRKSGRDWVVAASIRSTGFSSSLAIAKRVASLLGVEGAADDDPKWTTIPKEFHDIKLVPGQSSVQIKGRKFYVAHPQSRMLLSKL